MIALITGATSGIGKSTSQKLAEKGFNLILTGRRNERLTEIKKQLEAQFSIHVVTLNFDIRSREQVKKQVENLPEEFKQIDVLVNNAGLAAGMDLLQDGNIDDWEQMIDTNVKGLLYISKAVIPLMIFRKKGHIINIGSIAGKETYLKGNVYCASKHAVDSLTKAMRMDLLEHGIKVSSISPGMVETEFSEVRLKDKDVAKKVYNGLIPLTPEDIADTVDFILSRPDHVNINDIVIMPKAQANSMYSIRKDA
jgi:3-hydroxy acid dehydrogenase / malonic semialdehyde reductase